MVRDSSPVETVAVETSNFLKPKQPKTKHGFDWRFCQRLFTISTRVLFPSCCTASALILYSLLIFAAIEQVFIYYIGLIPSKFYGILIPKDVTAFRILAVNSVLFITGKAVIAALLTFTTALLYISWRRLLSRRMHKLYFNGNTKSYYYLNILKDAVGESLDNPDQRMTQDVDKFCLQLSGVVAPVLTAPFKIAWYAYQTFIVTGIYGPLAIFGYFLLGTIANKYIMSPITHYVYEQERAEGDFRYKHMQIRTYAESIAFYRSERVEYVLTNRRLVYLLKVLLMKARWQSCLSFSLGVFDYFGGILSYLLLAIPLFAGRYDSLKPNELSALISKNGFVCIMLVSSFSTLVDLANQAAEIAGNLHRVAQLHEVLEERRGNSGDTKKVMSVDDPIISGRRRHRLRKLCNEVVTGDDDINEDDDDDSNEKKFPDNVPATCSFSNATDGTQIWLAHSKENASPEPSACSIAYETVTRDGVSTPTEQQLNRYSAFCSTTGTPTSSMLLNSTATYPLSSTVLQPLPSLSIELCNISFGVPGSNNNNGIVGTTKAALIHNLSLSVRRGCNVLVSGPSSSGKTSLLRVLLNMWPLQHGRILYRYGPTDDATTTTVLSIGKGNQATEVEVTAQRIKNRLIMCLPQKPLLTNGSLRQQLIYPELVEQSGVSSTVASASLIELLHYVKLDHLLRTLVHDELDWDPASSSSKNCAFQWEDVLSPGEQQRLSFIRIFHHLPQFALLDEATSAVEPAMEERLYAKAKQLGITLISVGHRESLRKFHDVELKLDGSGGWSLVHLHQAAAAGTAVVEEEPLVHNAGAEI